MSVTEIVGLHHVTSLAADPQANNTLFTSILGLRRVKQTVNFDRPDVYHLYYGDRIGSAGTVMTFFPAPGRERGKKGKKGKNEVGSVAFSVPAGSLSFWRDRLAQFNLMGLEDSELFDERRLSFRSVDGDELVLVEAPADDREPWDGSDVPPDRAIRGFHSVMMRVNDLDAEANLLRFLGYEMLSQSGDVTRFQRAQGNGADIIDVVQTPSLTNAVQGAGSVHHIAFCVEDRAAQLSVRQRLLEAGYSVTPVIDRDYFWAIYFRTPSGILFEVATKEPGFDRDEEVANLGSALKLPSQHEHLRDDLTKSLLPLDKE